MGISRTAPRFARIVHGWAHSIAGTAAHFHIHAEISTGEPGLCACRPVRRLPTPMGATFRRPDLLIDISGIGELAEFRAGDDGLRIGASTRNARDRPARAEAGSTDADHAGLRQRSPVGRRDARATARFAPVRGIRRAAATPIAWRCQRPLVARAVSDRRPRGANRRCVKNPRPRAPPCEARRAGGGGSSAAPCPRR